MTVATTVSRRLTEWFDELNLTIQPIDSAPSGSTVYLLKDVFTTIDGSWEVTGARYAIPQWAKDAYENPSIIMELQKQNHLYAALLDENGTLIGQQAIRFINRYDPTNPDTRSTQDSTGWASFTLFTSSVYRPENGEQGPWCWAPVGLAESVCGGGLPADGRTISIFAVWQRATADGGETTPTPTEPPVTPTPTDPPVTPTDPPVTPTDPPVTPTEPPVTPTPGQPPAIERRLGTWVDDLRLEIKSIGDRPDHPAVTPGSVVYLIKDVFTTRDGSWEPTDVYGGIDQWARDAYLKPMGDPEWFDDAGADHHLFALVLDLDGTKRKVQELLYWSDGFALLGDPAYDGYVQGPGDYRYPVTKERSGWGNIVMSSSSNYVPARGEQGPWCWTPRGMTAEVMCGGGMPAKQHVSVFVVWQAVRVEESVTPPITDEHTTFLPFVSGGD